MVDGINKIRFVGRFFFFSVEFFLDNMFFRKYDQQLCEEYVLM